MTAPNVPPGYHTVTPSLTVEDPAAAIAFYTQAFGATEVFRVTLPGASAIIHAEFRIGDSVIMISGEVPETGAVSPLKLGGCPGVLRIYVADVDAATAQAKAAGATVMSPPETMFWGERLSMVKDPFGYRWHLAAHVEDVSPEEMDRRMRANLINNPN